MLGLSPPRNQDLTWKYVRPSSQLFKEELRGCSMHIGHILMKIDETYTQKKTILLQGIFTIRHKNTSNA